MSENQSKTNQNSNFSLLLDSAITSGVIIFLVLLPFHLVIKRLIPGPFGTYWKESLLVFLVFLWGVRCILAGKLLFTGSPLDFPVLLYLGIILLRLVLDRSGLVGLWGAYISILYLPLFWLIPLALRRFPKLIYSLVFILVGIGALISVGAIIEFIVDQPLWPSDELMAIQGYPDMFVYGTQLRRVYFVFDSPTTLANTVAIILPLATIIVFQERHLLVRLLSGLAAGLMLTAIILTFSRGIWVAIAFTILFILLIKAFIDNQWRYVIGAGAIAVIGILIFGIIWMTTPTSKADVDQYAIELLPQAYTEIPLGNDTLSLMDQEPEQGEAEKQAWTIYDPIQNVSDKREILYTHPDTDEPEQLIYTVNIPDRGLLKFSIAMSPEVWTPEKGDGVNFKIYIDDQDENQDDFVFIRYINPKANPNDRRWRNYAVDLSAWGGETVDLHLIAEAGPTGDYGYDWAGWSDLELGVAEEGYVTANWPEPKNPVVQHLTSITDWTNDESNRDRIAAWNQGLQAWRNNPIWGNGLGTTGVAALRTNPETAYVTESQVLKLAVELGLVGLIVWLFLWVIIGQGTWKLLNNKSNNIESWLELGLMAGLLIVFIEGIVYQNLEVKQVNAYFWTITGMLAFLWSRLKAQKDKP